MWMANRMLRLRARGLSGGKTALSLVIIRGTLGNYLRRTDEVGPSWSPAEGMIEEALERSLLPSPEPGTPGGVDWGGLSSRSRLERGEPGASAQGRYASPSLAGVP